MTDALLRRGHEVLAPLQRRDLNRAMALCARDPVASVVPAMHLEMASATGVIPTGLWAVHHPRTRTLVGVVFSGANLTAVLADDDDGVRAELAAAIIERLARPAALVGDASVTLDLWGRLEPWWGPARQVRAQQVSMALSTEATGGAGVLEGIEPLRRTVMSDFDALLPAAVHMFIGEVGYDPLQHGREAYEDRVRHLIRRGRSYVQYGRVTGERTVVFKAEVGVVGMGVAQVQGVWVHPQLRGQGVGRSGMAQLVHQIRSDHARTVSLYVNDFNEAAIRMYEAVGFQRVGMFSTVMF